jgi:hypothetical protein
LNQTVAELLTTPNVADAPSRGERKGGLAEMKAYVPWRPPADVNIPEGMRSSRGGSSTERVQEEQREKTLLAVFYR